jgi:hypothetical protein
MRTISTMSMSRAVSPPVGLRCLGRPTLVPILPGAAEMRARRAFPSASPASSSSRLHASTDSSSSTMPAFSLKSAALIGAPVVAMVLAATLTSEYTADLNPVQLYTNYVNSNPIETKACISGVVYSLGDYIAQNYEGRELAELDKSRILRSGICGLVAHGPLSHLYYVLLDHVFANQSIVDVNSWFVPVMKIGIDQTIWSVVWNSTYYLLLGVLKFENPGTILKSIQMSWLDLLKAGWRFWPIAHLLTYGVIPIQHRLIFVDTVELIWVCVLSTYGQRLREQAEPVACALPGAAAQGGAAAEEILRGLTAEHEVVETLIDGSERITKID